MPEYSAVPDPLHQAQVEQLFSLKEWMVAISGKLDRLETKLDGKADIQHVQAIDTRLMVVERQMVEERARNEYTMPQHTRLVEDVDSLKTQAASLASVDSYRRWVWGTAFISIVSFIAAVVSALLR